jgi:hypothetical protein
MATPAIAKLARLRRSLACTAPLILTQDYRARLKRVSVRTQPARSGRCTLTDRRDSHGEAPLPSHPRRRRAGRAAPLLLRRAGVAVRPAMSSPARATGSFGSSKVASLRPTTTRRSSRSSPCDARPYEIAAIAVRDAKEILGFLDNRDALTASATGSGPERLALGGEVGCAAIMLSRRVWRAIGETRFHLCSRRQRRRQHAR